MQANRHGLALAITGTTIWSVAPLFYQHLLEQYVALQPLTLIFWRDVIAGGVLAALLGVFRPQALRIGWRDVPFFLAYGLVGLALINGLWI
jgi:hypothetical protein